MSELKIDNNHLKAKVDWVCVFDKTCDKWVGVCDDLGLTVQADQQKELHTAIWEAMESLFSMLIEEGLLDKFLKEHDWCCEQSEPTAIKNVPVNIRVEEELLEGAFA
jgi:hypothetical protein